MQVWMVPNNHWIILQVALCNIIVFKMLIFGLVVHPQNFGRKARVVERFRAKGPFSLYIFHFENPKLR